MLVRGGQHACHARMVYGYGKKPWFSSIFTEQLPSIRIMLPPPPQLSSEKSTYYYLLFAFPPLGKPGTTFSIDINRGGEQKHLSLTLRDLYN